MDVTVLELHLPEVEFNTPFTGRERSDRGAADVREYPDEESSGGGSALAAIAVLVGLAVLAWYLRSRRDGGVEAEDVMAEGPA